MNTMNTMKEKVTNLDAFTDKKERQYRQREYERLQRLKAMPVDLDSPEGRAREDEIIYLLATVDYEVEAEVEAELKAQKDSGLSNLAWDIATLAGSLKARLLTESKALESIRTSFLGWVLLGPDDKPVWLDDGTYAKVTLSDIAAAIDEIKQAALWPWPLLKIAGSKPAAG